MKYKKDFLSITDLSPKEILGIFSVAKKLKTEYKQTNKLNEPLKNQTLVMIFEKPSLRTRVSFEAGITKLGGHAIYLGPNDIGMGTRESVHDIAKVVSSMGEIIMARTFKHKTIEELATYAKVPVINGLSDLEHPCQALADVLTIWETKGTIENLKIAFVGDGDNNVAHSLSLLTTVLGASFSCASPKGYWMNPTIVAKAKNITANAVIAETTNPQEAVANADVVYTDTWISMGDEKEKETRLKTFLPYQVTPELMKLAKKEAIFMHDLPAYRENEVTADVIDGRQSVVFQQAENRMWVQMALILHFISKT